MFRALLKKEWAQLRALRWVGAALGLLLPVFLLTGAEAARQGWLPFAGLSSYSLRTVLVDAMPPLLVALWGLLGLLIASQTFVGDRAEGTEAFLIERPVPRASVWQARLLVGLAVLLTLIAVHIAAWVVLASVFASPDAAQWGNAWRILGAAGGLSAALGFLGGVAAAALVGSPIQAVLLGLVLAVLPPGLASLLGGVFPMASIGAVPVGLVLPVLLLLGYPVGAFLALCRGEPAGRGRLLRGMVTIGLFLLSVPVVFAMVAPVSMRWDAAHRFDLTLFGSRGGAGAVVLGYAHGPSSFGRTSGWILDLERQEKIRFLPPPTIDVAWHPESTRLAVLHAAGPLGRHRSEVALQLFDARGRVLTGGFEFDPGIEWVDNLVWAGKYVVAKSAGRGRGSAVLILDSESGERRRVEMGQPSWTWSLVGPTDDGSLFVHRATSGDEESYVLQRLDPENAAIEPEVLVEEEGVSSWGKWISPTGRYWLRSTHRPHRMWVVDLESGNTLPLPGCARAKWLSGDRLLRLDGVGPTKTLRIGPPEDPGGPVRAWSDSIPRLMVSPDRRRVLIQVWSQTGQPPSDMLGRDAVLQELWVYEPQGENEWIDIHPWFPDPPSDPRRIQWAGPRTLAHTGPSRLAMRRLDADRWHDVIGGS